MKGLELARAFYEEYGAPMLRARFPQCEGLIAAGLVGAGSECFGFDDECSRDHDFEPGFCLFLPGEDLIDRRTAFALERAYAKLPASYRGFARLTTPPAGGYRHGVIRTADFYTEKTGYPAGLPDLDAWLSLPEQYLAEATNGAVFRDDLGAFSRLRAHYKAMPEDVRRKKLAGHLWMAAQCAPYNYGRCLAHGEKAAARFALYGFADHALSALFLMGRVYRPFYKWAFRAARSLPSAEIAGEIEGLLFGENDGQTEKNAAESVGRISDALRAALVSEGLAGDPRDLAAAAFEVNDGIEDNDLRNRSILAGV